MELGDDILLKLQHYFSGDMDEVSRASFEVEISNSEDLQEFVALYTDIDHLEDEERWNPYRGDKEELKRVAQLFQDKDTVDFTKKVQKFRSEATDVEVKNDKSYKLLTLALIAACVTVVFLLVFPQESTMTQLYTEYSTWDELPSFVVKGDATSQRKREVEEAFEEQEFELTISLSEQIMESTNETEANVQLYRGIAHLELNQFDEALSVFNDLAQSDSMDHHKAFWYIALVHLKQENKNETINSLRKVTSLEGNYRYKQALKILEELE